MPSAKSPAAQVGEPVPKSVAHTCRYYDRDAEHGDNGAEVLDVVNDHYDRISSTTFTTTTDESEIFHS